MLSYFKRMIEVLWIHRFADKKMNLSDFLVAFTYHWVFFGLVMWEILSPHYNEPVYNPEEI